MYDLTDEETEFLLRFKNSVLASDLSVEDHKTARVLTRRGLMRRFMRWDNDRMQWNNDRIPSYIIDGHVMVFLFTQKKIITKIQKDESNLYDGQLFDYWNEGFE